METVEEENKKDEFSQLFPSSALSESGSKGIISVHLLGEHP